MAEQQHKTQKSPNAARRSQASRHAILTAAFDLAGEIGYAKLSIEAIAARAGVGKQTIYRWWPSKGAVLFDAFLMLTTGDPGEGESAGGAAAGSPGDPGGPAEVPAAALPDTGDIEADLKTVLRATVAEMADPRYDLPMRALTSEVMNDPELAAAYVERLHKPVENLKLRRLRAAQEAGQIAADVDLAAAVDTIWSPLLSRWLLRTGPLDADYADRVVETAMRGLRPRGGSADI
ncbi:TetR/AcrR family transcriptional regulator [Streptodolium elevatio]|uniref:TetR/AcrR family transcriptional regulator n=1 Tax=Streptodolium elevatio TaxID=3157996 RepID=A0ABV3DPH7_9ACTN